MRRWGFDRPGRFDPIDANETSIDQQDNPKGSHALSPIGWLASGTGMAGMRTDFRFL
jgi:hypothetical protein